MQQALRHKSIYFKYFFFFIYIGRMPSTSATSATSFVFMFTTSFLQQQKPKTKIWQKNKILSFGIVAKRGKLCDCDSQFLIRLMQLNGKTRTNCSRSNFFEWLPVDTEIKVCILLLIANKSPETAPSLAAFDCIARAFNRTIPFFVSPWNWSEECPCANHFSRRRLHITFDQK